MISKSALGCWCGSSRFRPFGNAYLSCEDCETLYVVELPESDVTRVQDNETGLYGRRYFFDRQQELGHPDIGTRARTDLSDRCLYWLRTALKYRRPPGRALELGCAHGGFVSLLSTLGFDAVGLELSPWVVDYARHTFGVDMLQGPLEDQDLEPESFSLIAAMDVVEHMPEPAATLGRATELLRDDGILMIQTPCRPAGKSYRQLSAEGHRFPEMLLPDEHLRLFSEDGMRRLLHQLGTPHVTFEPALFAHYDMFCIASRQPLEPIEDDELHAELSISPAGRQLLAMLDLHRQLDERTREYLVADADRVGRQEQIDELHRLLAEQKTDRAEAEGWLRQQLEEQQRKTAMLEERLDELRLRGAVPGA